MAFDPCNARGISFETTQEHGTYGLNFNEKKKKTLLSCFALFSSLETKLLYLSFLAQEKHNILINRFQEDLNLGIVLLLLLFDKNKKQRRCFSLKLKKKITSTKEYFSIKNSFIQILWNL